MTVKDFLRRPALRWAPLVPLAAALCWHARAFDFVDDDAYISFVYARNFAEHNQLVYNLGDRVEGYTNFLWTLLLGVLMKLGIPPEVSSLVLGAAFAVGTLVVVVRLMERLGGGPSAWDYLPAALLAGSSGFACWTSGGLETQMFTFFLALGWLCYAEERLVGSGLAFAAASLTRPEGNLVFAVVVLHRLAANLLVERRLRPRRAELAWGAAFVALYVPYFAWRWWYYGWFFPNTFYVKAGGAPPDPRYAAKLMSFGAYYAWNWAATAKALWAAPLAILAVFAPRRRRFAALAWLVTAVYLAYAIKVGGDFMGLHRFIMPVFVTTALLEALGLRQLAEWLPPRARAAAGAALAATALAGFVASQVKLTRDMMAPWNTPGRGRTSDGPGGGTGIDRPGWLKLYAHDRGLIGKRLAGYVTPEDLSFVGGAGVQPYYARMRAYDVFGLVSEQIAHEVPPTRPRPGHQKWAPDAMVLAHRPTFIFFCYALHRAPRAYSLGCAAGGFLARGYEPVTIHVPGMRESGEYYTFLKRKDRAPPPDAVRP